jgi:membrane protein YdbS with pleckstrin-like domain
MSTRPAGPGQELSPGEAPGGAEAAGGWAGERALDHRVVVVWTVQEAIGYAVLAVAALAVDIGARTAGVDVPGPPGLAAGLVAVIGGLAAWWLPRARHRYWRYHVAADALELRHGVLKRVHSAIPYFRVQHIDVAQGPVERAVGLARLIVHTASAGTDATIPGIAAGDAEGLRRLILTRAGSGDAV